MATEGQLTDKHNAIRVTVRGKARVRAKHAMLSLQSRVVKLQPKVRRLCVRPIRGR
jgi:hypothetical protein